MGAPSTWTDVIMCASVNMAAMLPYKFAGMPSRSHSAIAWPVRGVAAICVRREGYAGTECLQGS